LKQPMRALVGIAEKSTKEAAEKSARRCSQKEHPREQPKPLEQPSRAAARAATKSSRRNGSDRSSRIAVTKTFLERSYLGASCIELTANENDTQD